MCAPAISPISTRRRIKSGPSTSWPAARCRPGFRPVEIEGEFYWDGGIVSNTPLQWVLDSHPRADTLAFQVDLWNARGELPRDLNEVDLRTKEIRYSSRTRLGTDEFQKTQRLRRAVNNLLETAAGGPPHRSRMEIAGIRGRRESL